MMKRLLMAVVLAVFAVPAVAQQQNIDPRTVAQTINALQAMLALREAEMKAMQQDWAAYSAPLWQTPPATEPPPAAPQ